MSRLVKLYHYFKKHLPDPYPEAQKADRAVARRLRGLGATEDDKQVISAAAVAHEIRGFALGAEAARGEDGQDSSRTDS